MERVEELLRQKESKEQELEVVAADKAKWKRVLPGYRLMLLFGVAGIASSVVLSQKAPEVHHVAIGAGVCSGVATVLGIVGIENKPYDRFNSRAQLDLIDLKLEAITLVRHHLELTQVQAEAAVGRVDSSGLRELCNAFSDPSLKVHIPLCGTEIVVEEFPIKKIGVPAASFPTVSIDDIRNLNEPSSTVSSNLVWNGIDWRRVPSEKEADLCTPQGTEDQSDA